VRCKYWVHASVRRAHTQCTACSILLAGTARQSQGAMRNLQQPPTHTVKSQAPHNTLSPRAPVGCVRCAEWPTPVPAQVLVWCSCSRRAMQSALAAFASHGQQQEQNSACKEGHLSSAENVGRTHRKQRNSQRSYHQYQYHQVNTTALINRQQSGLINTTVMTNGGAPAQHLACGRVLQPSALSGAATLGACKWSSGLGAGKGGWPRPGGLCRCADGACAAASLIVQRRLSNCTVLKVLAVAMP